MAWTAAPLGAWRDFDPEAPDPGYFQFDWLSARHPDLYDAFALSSAALIDELCTILDFAGEAVADVGAGTGRSTVGLARRARHVIAIDAFPSVCEYGASRVQEQRLSNVSYLVGDRDHLPLADDSVDCCVACWAALNRGEAYRVTKPGGILVLGEGVGGELDQVLREDVPDLVRDAPQVASAASFSVTVGGVVLPDARFINDEIRYHEFSFVADYGDADDAAAILGRIFGPRVRAYMRNRRQSTLASRLGIYYGQIAK
jgi:SAM-dependent methyltransferase